MAGPATEIDQRALAALDERIEERAVERFTGELAAEVLAIRASDSRVAGANSVGAWIGHATSLQNRAEANAPVTLAGHFAQAAVEEAVELAVEPHANAGLGFVAPPGHLRAVLPCL